MPNNIPLKTNRIDQLDGVRALAIGAVFLHHAFGVKMLWAGVDLFFVLSGFLITGVLLGSKDKSLRGYFGHFYQRRARRILPPYAILLLVTSLLLGIAWMSRWYFYLFLMNVLVAWQLPEPKPLEVLWSLAVEEQFYLVWPFVIFFLSETAIAWTAGTLVVLAPLLRWYFTPFFWSHWAVYALMPFRMDLLAAGALLALLWRRNKPWIERYGAFGLALLAASSVGLLALGRIPGFSTFANNAGANVWIYELCLFASVGVILWALSGRLVQVLRWPPMTYLGRISYTVYLVHTLVLFTVRKHLVNPWESAVVSLALTILYAAFSWHFLEQPILFWKPRNAVPQQAERDEEAVTIP